MFGRLKESVLSYIIKVMVHKREVLTKKERAAQDAFMAKLGIKRRGGESSRDGTPNPASLSMDQ